MRNPFVPKELPLEISPHEEINLLNSVIKVTEKIKEFQYKWENLPLEKDQYPSFTWVEAVKSNLIEGTHVSVEGMLEADLTSKTSQEMQEAMNYLEALHTDVSTCCRVKIEQLLKR